MGEFFCIFDIIIFCLSMTPPFLKMFPFQYPSFFDRVHALRPTHWTLAHILQRSNKFKEKFVSLIHYKIGLDLIWNDAHENGLFDSINITPCFEKCHNKTTLLLTFTQESHQVFQNISFSTFNCFQKIFTCFLEYIKIFFYFWKKADSSSLRSSSKTPY